MVNQQLLDYINQQRSSGTGDRELEERLIESGWPIGDVQSALGLSGKSTEDAGTGIDRFDLNSPGVYELGLVRTEAEKTNETEVAVIKTASGGGKNAGKGASGAGKWGLILISMMLVLTALGIGFWYLWSNGEMISPLSEKSISETKLAESRVRGAVTEQRVLNNGWYENAQLEFGIKPPAGWRADTSGTFGTLVVFTNPVLDEEGNNKFTANMNIVAEQTDQSPEKYLEASKELLGQSFENHVLISERQAEIEGGNGIILESTFDQGVFKLHNLQLVTVNDGRVIVVTTVSLDGKWQKYAPVFEEVIRSFEFR